MKRLPLVAVMATLLPMLVFAQANPKAAVDQIQLGVTRPLTSFQAQGAVQAFTASADHGAAIDHPPLSLTESIVAAKADVRSLSSTSERRLANMGIIVTTEGNVTGDFPTLESASRLSTRSYRQPTSQPTAQHGPLSFKFRRTAEPVGPAAGGER